MLTSNRSSRQKYTIAPRSPFPAAGHKPFFIGAHPAVGTFRRGEQQRPPAMLNGQPVAVTKPPEYTVDMPDPSDMHNCCACCCSKWCALFFFSASRHVICATPVAP